jgi:hypothetical protein
MVAGEEKQRHSLRGNTAKTVCSPHYFCPACNLQCSTRSRRQLSGCCCCRVQFERLAVKHAVAVQDRDEMPSHPHGSMRISVIQSLAIQSKEKMNPTGNIYDVTNDQ